MADGKLNHAELCVIAVEWLYRKFDCGVVVSGRRRGVLEMPDALGFLGRDSVLVECKATRQDYRQDAKKLIRQQPELGMGKWRIYLAPPGVIDPDTLPSGWGLAEAERRGRGWRVTPVRDSYTFERDAFAEIERLAADLASSESYVEHLKTERVYDEMRAEEQAMLEEAG